MNYQTRTDFFRFQSFYNRLRNHITHFQLRNLVVCPEDISKGIFYPSSYYHDSNFNVVTLDAHANIDNPENYMSFFKINRLMHDDKDLSSSKTMKLDCLIDSRTLNHNANSRISSCACSNRFLVCGTFEGGYLMLDISDPNAVNSVGEYSLTGSADGITNHILIGKDDEELIIASNDQYLRIMDNRNGLKKQQCKLPLAVNCLAVNPRNENELFVVGDDTDGYILDKRSLRPDSFSECTSFSGHKDYGFSCDWSPIDEHILLSGNQDGTVRLWDRRNPKQDLFCWSSALGSYGFDVSNEQSGGPVRNCKFSYHGSHVIWAESLDHVGILQVDDLDSGCDKVHSRVQSIDFIGKCIGLSTCPTDSSHGEQLVIGVNDCPLGGILNYQLEATDKPLDFDFSF